MVAEVNQRQLSDAGEKDGWPLSCLVASGKAAGNSITLQLTAPTAAKTIAYLSGKHWDGRPNKLLYGTNGIAALTFCDVEIKPESRQR